MVSGVLEAERLKYGKYGQNHGKTVGNDENIWKSLTIALKDIKVPIEANRRSHWFAEARFEGLELLTLDFALSPSHLRALFKRPPLYFGSTLTAC
jgi:hypothetical protein